MRREHRADTNGTTCSDLQLAESPSSWAKLLLPTWSIFIVLEREFREKISFRGEEKNSFIGGQKESLGLSVGAFQLCE